MKNTATVEPITIDQPMVLISTDEYETLLREAGLRPTPVLDKRISMARKNFRLNRVIAWDKIKIQIGHRRDVYR